jgi:hypothetical protein
MTGRPLVQLADDPMAKGLSPISLKGSFPDRAAEPFGGPAPSRRTGPSMDGLLRKANATPFDRAAPERPDAADDAAGPAARRPYRNESLDRLYREAKGHWSSIPSLLAIGEELSCRTTAHAKRLEAELANRIAVLRVRPGFDKEPPGAAGRDGGALAEEVRRLRAEKEEAETRLAGLHAVLRQARDTIRWQEQRLDEIRRQERRFTAAEEGSRAALYRRVGLDEACPDFVFKAARTAYRRALHPDTRPDHEKSEAERRFKEAESVFDAIARLRSIRG